MLLKFFLFITGILLTSLSLMFIIMYFNLCTMGYTFLEYVNFIIRKVECLIGLLGILLILISMHKRKEQI